MAVIILAKTCNMYEKSDSNEDDHNPLAASVCYANIANLQLKNARYEIAYANYTKAIKLGEEELREYVGRIEARAKDNYLEPDNEDSASILPLPDEEKKNFKDITNYLQIVLAHRMYQRAMCRFKFARYVMCEEDSCLWQPEDDTSAEGRRLDYQLGRKVLGTFLEVKRALE